MFNVISVSKYLQEYSVVVILTVNGAMWRWW